LSIRINRFVTPTHLIGILCEKKKKEEKIEKNEKIKDTILIKQKE
jgi:hypothetical protein